MSIIDINPIYGAFGGGHPVNWARNGIAPPGPGAADLAGYLNFLMGARVKTLFAKFIDPTVPAGSPQTDQAYWTFACHTSPLATEVEVRLVVLPLSSAASGVTSYAYWSTETGLTGSGTTAARARMYCSSAVTGSAPDQYVELGPQRFAVTADQDYRFTLHCQNGMRVLGATVYEVPRVTLDTSSDTNGVDSTKLYHNAHVHDAQTLAVVTAASKIWKRSGGPIFAWAANQRSDLDADARQITCGGANENLLDTTRTAWTAAGPGFWCYPQYRDSLDSTNVGVVAWSLAHMSAGTGDMKLLFTRNGATVASITVTATSATWQTATGTLTGANATDKIDVVLQTTGTGTGYVWSCGMFYYTA